VYRGQLAGIAVTPAGGAVVGEVSVEGGLVSEALPVDEVAVDQDAGRAQRELSVMTEKHLTHDLLTPYGHDQLKYYS
jgi:hypothetical protein